MTPRVILRPRALRDLVNHSDYIATDNPAAAQRFLDAAERAFHRLVALPRIGRLRRFRRPALRGLRSSPIREFPNYVVYYFPRPDGIDVVRVLHGARDVRRALDID